MKDAASLTLPRWSRPTTRFWHGMRQVEIECYACGIHVRTRADSSNLRLAMAMHCKCEKPPEVQELLAAHGVIRLIAWLTKGAVEDARLASWKRQQELNAQHAERQRDADVRAYMKRKDDERFEERLYCKYNAGEPLSANHEAMAKRVYDRCGQWGYFPPR